MKLSHQSLAANLIMYLKHRHDVTSKHLKLGRRLGRLLGLKGRGSGRLTCPLEIRRCQRTRTSFGRRGGPLGLFS
eukprot:scaffold664070_cov73-Prasinocladus_malaysianus.AAC.1